VATVRLQNEEGAQSGRYYEFDPENKSSILGRGGMGVVFEGRLLSTAGAESERVAVKVLFKDLSAESVTRARSEASIRIVHENIVRMYDFVETADVDGRPRYHVISEYLDGETLDKVIERSGLFPEARAIKITKSVLAALYMLHNRGYVHRDIDPSNVMLCRDGKVKLIDFGIARLTREYRDEQLKGTQEGQFIGKINYASPEQAEGKHRLTNASSDIYSTGILLYELLTGSLPFSGTIYEIIKAHRETPVPRNKAVSESLQYVIGKATAKDQKARYQSATEFIVDLERVEKGESPVTVSPARWLYPAAGVVAAVILVAGVWFFLRGRSERYRATLERASEMMSVAMYHEALGLYEDAFDIISADSVGEKVDMLRALTEGVDNYISSDYAAADSLFEAASAMGSSDAFYYLGEMSYEGIGCPKDFARGFACTTKAAGMGNKLALYRLGLIYTLGIDVEKDPDRAARYFETAVRVIDKGAEADNPELRYVKGSMYMYGNGVPENKSRATEYYRSAAALGYPRAQYELYEALSEEDREEAVGFLTASADRGYPKAAFRLGALLLGEGRYKEGYEYTVRAAERNYSPALRQLGAIYQEKGKSALTSLIQESLGIRGDDSLSHLYTVKALDYDFDNYMAMYDAAMDFLLGKGVTPDLQRAIKYFEAARQKVGSLPFRTENGRRVYNEVQHPMAGVIAAFDYKPYIR
jgi:serine/threonine protein kinase